MVDQGERKSNRLESISQAISIAVSALSAGMILYREYLALRRQSREHHALQAELDEIKAQLSSAQKAQRLDGGTQESLTRQISEVRQKVRKYLAAENVDSELGRAQDALESLAMSSRPYLSSSGPRDGQFRQSTSGGFPRWAEDDPYPPPPNGARYYAPPPTNTHYYQSNSYPSPPSPPHGATYYSPTSGHHYGSRAYPARGNQRGPQR